MTTALIPPTAHRAPLEQAPAASEPRRMQQLRTRDASDHFAMYRAGFYVTSDRQTGEFYWDRRDDRYIVALGAEVSDKARHIMKKEVRVPVRCSFNAHPAAVLDHLQDVSIKPRTWVSAEVRRIYEEMIAAGTAFTMEAVHEGQLVGGLIGIASGLGRHHRHHVRPARNRKACDRHRRHCCVTPSSSSTGSAPPASTCRISIPENHPWQRLGETKISMDELRCASLSRTWIDPIIIARATGDIDDKWLFIFRGDFGGFGVGSDFTFQVQGYVGYRFSKLFQTSIGYRVIGIDYDKGSGEDRFRYNMNTFGPNIRLGFNL